MNVGGTECAVIAITLEGDRLNAQLACHPAIEIFPESEKEYFYKVVGAQITFDSDGKGQASALTLHQNGRNMRAPRLAD